jgi:hypothetical protein
MHNVSGNYSIQRVARQQRHAHVKDVLDIAALDIAATITPTLDNIENI